MPLIEKARQGTIDEDLINEIAAQVPQEMAMALSSPRVKALAKNTLNLVFGGNSMAELRQVQSNRQEQGGHGIFAKTSIPNGTEIEVWSYNNFLKYDFKNQNIKSKEIGLILEFL